MAKQHNDDLDPERFGRAAREGREEAHRVRSGVSRSRRGGTSGRAQRRDGSRPTHGGLPQRVVAKVRVVRHHTPQKSRASLRRHIGYLTREAVTHDVGSGRFFDATRDDINAGKESRAWREDRHHFRVVVSPEHARELNDLKGYVRETLTRIQHDLGDIEWIAVNHTNTNNPHTHILIRGRASDGSDLVIPRDYIARGIRGRAAEVATEWLGERTRDDARSALAREAQAERFTSLDRVILRTAEPTPEGLRINLSAVRLSRHSLTTVELLRERLGVLNRMGVANRQAGRTHQPQSTSQTWYVAPDFESRLRELGERNDILKHLHQALGRTAAHAAVAITGLPSDTARKDKPPSPVRGLLVAKNVLDEQSDERLVIVEGHDGKPRHARVWADPALDAVDIGGVVEIGRGAQRRWSQMREVIEVARSNDTSTYSTAAHRAWLQRHRTNLTRDQAEHRLRRFSKSVIRLARQAESGVTHSGKNVATINPKMLEQCTARRSRWLDVRVHATHSLSSQTTAKAYTWLDRQMIRIRLSETLPQNDITHMPAVRAAMGERAAWLVEHGFAERDPGSKDQHAVRFPYGAIDHLRSVELKNFAQQCKEKNGKGFSILSTRREVPGVYHSTVNLHQGTYAVVATWERFYGAPVSSAPRIERGTLITAKVVNSRHSTFGRREPRNPQRSTGMDR